MPRLRRQYVDEIVPALVKEFRYRNAMQVPQVSRTVLNVGLGEAITNARAIDAATADLRTITGQAPIVIRARKSVAAFKLREGMPIGAKVTLRGKRMYEFPDKLINVALPRIRDFRGIEPKAFDGHGNYTLGLREQLVFPEIDYDKIDRLRGL
ncbi:MAG: 50S ribosomal protein L5, partial [Candidatus Dormibacteraeota bacterium]|nr:50S ribosomal protein L5 [Candidatus Dormibacteraeota bacterium]